LKKIKQPFPKLDKITRRVAHHFLADHCTQIAAALTYTSLLSLVPLLAVGFSLLSAFPVFESLSNDVQKFIFMNFVPASRDMIQNYLIDFTDKASHLTLVGIIFLIITALLLVEAIDRAVSDIWKVRQRRSGLSKFMAYWAILSLSPMLIGISLAVTSYLVSLPFISGVAETLVDTKQFLSFMPFGLTTLAFILIYVIVPNRYVPLSHGITGGILAALLFEVAKKGFAYYVTEVATYELIYGTLSSIPVFLLWVYLSWVIILLGVEITRSLGDYDRDSESFSNCISSNDNFIYAFHLIGHLWQAQRQGKLLTVKKLIQLEPRFQNINIDILLNHLEKKLWIHIVENHRYALSRDIHESTLLDLYKSLSDLLLKTDIIKVDTDNVWNQSLNAVFDKTDSALTEVLQIPLYEFYQSLTQDIVQKKH